MPFFDPIRIGASGAADTAFTVDRSLRFSGADQTRLNYTPASGGNKKTWTFSWWLKRGSIERKMLFGSYNSGATTAVVELQDDHNLNFYDYNSGYRINLETTQVFRDPSAWYHFVIALDTTQSTDSNRVKIYVNGSQITDFASATYPSQNFDGLFNDHTIQHAIGTEGSLQRLHFDGYMAEIYFLDGYAYDPSYFGETNATTGQWIPKEYTGSFGNNGYYLKFDDNSATTATTLGKDSSGNGNNVTPVNFSVSAGSGNDSLEDTPTNNFATFNPLHTASGTNFATFTNGNLDHSLAVSQNASSSFLIPKTGKWYAEFVLTAGAVLSYMGVRNPNLLSGIFQMQFTDDGSSLSAAAQVRVDNTYTETLSSSYANNDILGIKVDRDAGTVQFTKNGTNNSTAVSLSGASDTSDLVFYIARSQSGSYSFAGSVNFGQRPFSYLPTGYKSLCSQNLPVPTILLPNKHFEAEIWTGTGSQRAITGYDFAPDWVWVKRRSNSGYHILANTLSGANNYMVTNTNSSESVGGGSQLINGFNSDGFDVGTEGAVNASSETYVGWCWNAGDSDGKTYAVTVVSDSGNKYRFDGYGTSAVTLDLAEGGTYVFDWSDSSAQGHPIRFSTTSDGTHGGGSEYTTGVTKDDSAYKTTITVAASAPTLYYYCQNHSGMGGQVNTNSTVGSSNFDGSIQSRVKVNASAGMSIINFTGTGADGTVGHGLGVTPSWVLVKNTDSDEHWTVKHKDLTSGYNLKLNLNENQGQSTGSTNGIIADLSSSSNFSLTRTGNTGNYDNVNLSGDNHFAVCFSEVEGYSKFGIYTGNNNADGPFIHTGFRPAWLMVKILDLDNWYIVDNKRDPHNVMDHRLFADTESAEGGIGQEHVDFCSNGFKWRRAKTPFNNNFNYVYFCFAESPFKNSRAR